MLDRNFKPATQIEARPNFSSLLDEAPTEVKWTPPIPQGSYVAVIQPGWTKTTSRKGDDVHEFNFKLIQPFEDVDEEELQTWINDNGPITEKIFKRQFYITPNAIPYLDEFHQASGIDLSKKVSRLLRNDEVGNHYIGVYLKHRPFSDGSGKVAVDIDRFFPVEGN